MRRARWRLAVVVAALVGSLVPAVPGGTAPEATAPTAIPGVTTLGYEARYLVEPNPLNSTEGLFLDGKGGLYICRALNNGLVRMDLATRTLTVIADEFDSEPLQVPDDVAVGPDGYLYVTNLLGRTVVRMSPDGKERKVIGTNLGDGGTGTNAIAFNAEGRLFATDLSFADPSHPGGLWELDPAGVKPPIPVVRPLPTPNGFAFGPDGLAYIPEMFDGRIDVVDVDARTVRTLVDGFGYLVSVEFDAQGRLVVLETDTGKVWRVDRLSGERTLLAQGDPGLDNVVVFPDGEIWVSNFVGGNVRRVDAERGVLVPILPERPLSLPFSLDEAPDGSLLVGDFTAVTRIRSGAAQRLSRLLVNDLQLLTPGAVEMRSGLYFTDFLPPDGRIFRADPLTGRKEKVASGFGYPWTIREGAKGHLLVGDQALGTVFDVDPATGVATPLLQGLTSPSGLAYDAERGVVYAADTGAGRIVAVNLDSRRSAVVASGLSAPEGIDVAADGQLLVVEADAGRLLRVDPHSLLRIELARGLPTRTVGMGLPLLNFSSDVLARSDGSIVVTGPADASLIELTPR